MIKVHYPPTTPFIEEGELRIFLAGTIDMGLSTDWQTIITSFLTPQFTTSREKINIINPRRKDWDSGWEQSPRHPMFRRQVEWELEQQEKAHLILMVLLEGSQSPISLMELGSFKHKPMMVYNPERFYRFGNVEIFCKKYDIQTFQDWDDYLIAIRRKIDYFVTKIC